MLVSDEIIKVLDAISDKIGLSIDWSVENVLPYLETLTDKFIRYEIGTSIIWITLAGIVIICSLYLFKYSKVYFKKYQTSHDYDDEFSSGCLLAFGIAVLGIGVIIIIRQSLDIIGCYTFPEKIILDRILSYYSNM